MNTKKNIVWCTDTLHYLCGRLQQRTIEMTKIIDKEDWHNVRINFRYCEL